MGPMYDVDSAFFSWPITSATAMSGNVEQMTAIISTSAV
jgi:hypothetical protein